jgi:Fe-S-cluster containining protein
MPQKDSIFLDREELLAAIRDDFRQYGPQLPLFLELCPVVFGRSAVAARERSGERVWLEVPGKIRRCRIDPETLGRMLCDEMERAATPLETLAAVASRVFRAPALPVVNPETGVSGIRLETGMEGFACCQCGDCCERLGYHIECGPEDVHRWEALGRNDILEWVKVHHGRDGGVSYSVWTHPGTSRYADRCPWLERDPDSRRHRCRIHDVKPAVCREYPGSRKHAVMTGCRGFEKDHTQ